MLQSTSLPRGCLEGVQSHLQVFCVFVVHHCYRWLPKTEIRIKVDRLLCWNYGNAVNVAWRQWRFTCKRASENMWHAAWCFTLENPFWIFFPGLVVICFWFFFLWLRKFIHIWQENPFVKGDQCLYNSTDFQNLQSKGSWYPGPACNATLRVACAPSHVLQLNLSCFRHVMQTWTPAHFCSWFFSAVQPGTQRVKRTTAGVWHCPVWVPCSNNADSKLLTLMSWSHTDGASVVSFGWRKPFHSSSQLDEERNFKNNQATWFCTVCIYKKNTVVWLSSSESFLHHKNHQRKNTWHAACKVHDEGSPNTFQQKCGYEFTQMTRKFWRDARNRLDLLVSIEIHENFDASFKNLTPLILCKTPWHRSNLCCWKEFWDFWETHQVQKGFWACDVFVKSVRHMSHACHVPRFPAREPSAKTP